LDFYGNVATGYAGKVHLTSNDSTASFPQQDDSDVQSAAGDGGHQQIVLGWSRPPAPDRPPVRHAPSPSAHQLDELRSWPRSVISSEPAGQTRARAGQLMQLAGRGIQGSGPAMVKQSVGQISQHKPQPVHFVSSKAEADAYADLDPMMKTWQTNHARRQLLPVSSWRVVRKGRS
jgi:hypothetical protein